MRLNKYIAQATGLSRRAADLAISSQRVLLNGELPQLGSDVTERDTVTLDGRPLTILERIRTILLNKPRGYVVSRRGQGSKTIYELLPESLHSLKPVGRLDKASSGVLILTNDGQLANELTHPRYTKRKVYMVNLSKPLAPLHRQMINDVGVTLADGRSKLTLTRIHEGDDRNWQIEMSEGRNRQIRRTFAALNYLVTGLDRTQFGPYTLDGLPVGHYREIPQ